MSVYGSGKIITFYSYKGGVGRTMALANAAFLAATNGYRVLVMDWDLEAPGLAYYFRGLLDGTAAREMKDAPGVLDFLWEWSSSVAALSDEDDVDSFIGKFFNSKPFERCVSSLADSDLMPMIKKLDYIGSGARSIVGAESRSYEEALAAFSWQDFFNERAGGYLLERLKEWARENYDFIFIDSRTGFADVSGICTMQLPDIVALCFVLNRQNIDGVARVSVSIREQLKDKVKIRAIPMRVARIDTSEESDARARAISDLTRIGQFSSLEIVDDFKALQIVSDENMPFYETLAPLVTEDPALHPLSVSYLRMANSLLGVDLKIPAFSPDFIELARRRLMPRQATLEYIRKLGGFEPERALDELRNLIEGALETQYEVGEIEFEYVKALVEAVDNVNDFAEPEIPMLVRSRSIELVRVLYAADHQKWRAMFQQVLESMVETFWFMQSFDLQLSFLEELDGVLAESPTVASSIKRISYKRKAVPVVARLNGESDGVEQILAEISYLIESIEQNYQSLAADQLEYLATSRADVEFMRGTHCAISDEERVELFCKALSILIEFDGVLGGDARSLIFTLNVRVAETLGSEDKRDIARYLLNAFKIWPSGYLGVSQFNRISRLIVELEGHSKAEVAYEFLTVALLSQSDRTLLANAFGRSTHGILVILESITDMLFCLDSNMDVGKAVGDAAETLDAICRNFLRRRDTLKNEDVEKIQSPILRVVESLEKLGVDVFSYPNLIRARSFFA
ncbi:AAA family ATPase [Pseudomonas sp. PDM26]|uniref:KGGVGR-motif variant AAA ATPase n=1 Tax=Pseudomonas sp. PDM26 TaxID=2854766 RepID=UPI001C485068|nr:AAA family ATPase [Pseudomonas sp. PDM26]